MISLEEPDGGGPDLGMDDYRRLGVMAALDAIERHRPEPGPWESAIASARCSRSRPPPWRWTATSAPEAVSLLAAQVDFREAGELTPSSTRVRSTSWRT